MNLTPKQINRTLRQLVKKGLIKQNAQGGYEPTPKGIKFNELKRGITSHSE